QDRAPLGANSFTRADLARPFLHADIGDVHDADGADKQRQARDEESRAGDARLDRTHRRAQALLRVDLEVVLLFRTQPADAAHVSPQFVARRLELILVLDLDADLRVGARAEVLLERDERN